MKTIQIMERDLNGVKVRQNHKSGFFNANDLLELHNTNAENKKDIWDYLRSKTFKEYRNAVLNDILQNTADSRYLQLTATERQEIEIDNLTVETKRGKFGGTWMHPLVFIDFAMWLSPQFKVSCIKWLYDKLIIFRDQCGDSFKEVTDALFEQKPNRPPFEYSNEANMINKFVFGQIGKGLRNQATETQLAMLKAMQKADAKLIQNGLDYYERYEKLKEVKATYLLTT